MESFLHEEKEEKKVGSIRSIKPWLIFFFGESNKIHQEGDFGLGLNLGSFSLWTSTLTNCRKRCFQILVLGRQYLDPIITKCKSIHGTEILAAWKFIAMSLIISRIMLLPLLFKPFHWLEVSTHGGVGGGETCGSFILFLLRFSFLPHPTFNFPFMASSRFIHRATSIDPACDEDSFPLKFLIKNNKEMFHRLHCKI